MNIQKMTLAILAGAGLVGCVLPWYSMNFGGNIPFLSNSSFGGFLQQRMNVTMLSFGWLIILSFIASMVIPFLSKPTNTNINAEKTTWLLISSGLSVVLILIGLLQLVNTPFLSISIGIGAYISLLSSIGIVVLAIKAKKEIGKGDTTIDAIIEEDDEIL